MQFDDEEPIKVKPIVLNKPKAPKELTFKLSRRKFVVLTLLVLIILALVFVYTGGYADGLLAKYRQAKVTMTVRDNSSGQPIEGAAVKLGTLSVKTNIKGAISINNTITGRKTLQVSKNGFYKYQTSVYILRGSNKLPDVLLKQLPAKKFTYSGKVVDKITKDLISSAKILFDNKETTSDTSGVFSISDIVAGKYLATVDATGYMDYKKEIDVAESKTPVEYQLTLDKTIYFLSNRDGAKGIYSTKIDGSDIKRVIAKSDKGEENDFIPSPNYNFAYFSSYRDGKLDESGNKKAYGYLVNFADSDFWQISYASSLRRITWSDDSKYLVYLGEIKESNKDKNILAYYDTISKQEKIIWKGEGYIYDFQVTSSNTVLYSSSRSGGDKPDILEGLRLCTLSDNNQKQILLDKPYDLKQDKMLGKIYFKVQRDNLKYEFDTDSQIVKEILSIPDSINDYLFSPNGQKVIFTSTRDGQADVYIKPASGGDEVKITSSGTAQNPIWLSDSMIIYYVQKPGETALYISSINNPQSFKIIDVTIPFGSGNQGIQ